MNETSTKEEIPTFLETVGFLSISLICIGIFIFLIFSFLDWLGNKDDKVIVITERTKEICSNDWIQYPTYDFSEPYKDKDKEELRQEIKSIKSDIGDLQDYLKCLGLK